MPSSKSGRLTAFPGFAGESSSLGFTPVDDGFILRTASVIIDAKTGKALETYVR